MSNILESNKPIFMQIRKKIEDQIVNKQLTEGDQAPSTNQLVKFYNVNHATVSKGINQLVEEGILYKKRGIGMFVAEGARKNLLIKRREAFTDEYLLPLILEADKIGITKEEIVELIHDLKDRGRVSNDK